MLFKPIILMHIETSYKWDLNNFFVLEICEKSFYHFQGSLVGCSSKYATDASPLKTTAKHIKFGKEIANSKWAPIVIYTQRPLDHGP
jgi:hypothetical protein